LQRIGARSSHLDACRRLAGCDTADIADAVIELRAGSRPLRAAAPALGPRLPRHDCDEPPLSRRNDRQEPINQRAVLTRRAGLVAEARPSRPRG
jgi:hypothetical protein